MSWSHSTDQYEIAFLLDDRIERLVLRWTSGKIIELVLPAREDTERSAGLGAAVPNMRFGGRARVLRKRLQPMADVTSEDTMDLLSDNVHRPRWHCEEEVSSIVLLRRKVCKDMVIQAGDGDTF